MNVISRAQGIDIAKSLKQIWQKKFPTTFKDVYLFGSVARNQATEDSDIDIAVVCTPFARSKIREARELYSAFPDMDARVSIVVVHQNELGLKTAVLPETIRVGGIAI